MWQQLIHVWDPATGRVARVLAGSADWSPEALAWSPDGGYLAARAFNDNYGEAADNRAPIRIWKVATGERVCVLRQQGAFLEGPVWSPGGRRLACAASDGSVRIWDVAFLSDRSYHRQKTQLRSPPGRALRRRSVEKAVGAGTGS